MCCLQSPVLVSAEPAFRLHILLAKPCTEREQTTRPLTDLRGLPKRACKILSIVRGGSELFINQFGAVLSVQPACATL